MIRRCLLAFAVLACVAGQAWAEPADGNLYAGKVAVSAATAKSAVVGRATGERRPADCYGIPWCGCWLRHHLGLKDVRLNLAHNWSKYFGRSAGKTPAVGDVAVFYHRHVGIVTGIIDSRHVMVLSGNDGHAVRERPRDIRSIAEFRTPT